MFAFIIDIFGLLEYALLLLILLSRLFYKQTF
jgi:hypothetical protein